MKRGQLCRLFDGTHAIILKIGTEYIWGNTVSVLPLNDSPFYCKGVVEKLFPHQLTLI